MRPPRDNAVWRFALRALLWLVPCFAAWYAVAAFHARPVAWIARAIVDAFMRANVTALEWSGRLVTMVTDVTVQVDGGARAVLAPEIDPLVYTYGAALFAALALASRMRPGRILLGLAILLPFHAFGVAFEALVEIGVKVAPDVAARAGLLGARREMIALGYQLGSLILPTLAPIVVWAALDGLGPLLPPAMLERMRHAG